jgi:hypothetical protein
MNDLFRVPIADAKWNPMHGSPVRLVVTALAAVSCLAGSAIKAEQVAHESKLSKPHAIIELRQYTLHPGQRDVLVDMFDAYFVEGQEDFGMRVIGQFRDLTDPDRFVWLRSFEDMSAREKALTAFYTGPVWQSHRNQANATMVDSDNVLLLRPARSATGFRTATEPPPPRGTMGRGRGIVIGNIAYLRRAAPEPFIEFFQREIKPHLEKAGTSIVAELVTETSPNTFSRLPVREGEKVFVWFCTFANDASYEHYRRTLAQSPEWRALVGKLSLWTHQPIEMLKLEPTARSRLQAG